MRHVRVLFASISVAALVSPVSCATTSPSAPPLQPPPGKAWGLTFDASFDGNALDRTKLTPCFDWNYGDNCTSSFNSGREHYLPSQVQLSDGLAHLAAEPLNPPLPSDACFEGSCTYKSGLLSTARPTPSEPYLYTFKYGYVEARMKFPSTPGMFTAFWLLPADPDYRYRYEIDIVENLPGKTGVVYQTYHYDDRQKNYKVNDISHDTNGTCPKADYSKDFHNFGADWQPDHVSFYIDGTECGRFAATDPNQVSNEPMQIIINLMVDTAWQRQIGLTLPSQTSSDRLDIDYVRVWQAM